MGSNEVTSVIPPAPAFYATAVTAYFLQPDWLIAAVNDLVEIGRLPENWNSYGSPALTEPAKRQAFDVALKLSRMGVPEPQIAPVSGGGVQFTCNVGVQSLELEVLPDGAVDFLRVYDDDTMKEGRIKVGFADQLNQQVRWLMEHP